MDTVPKPVQDSPPAPDCPANDQARQSTPFLYGTVAHFSSTSRQFQDLIKLASPHFFIQDLHTIMKSTTSKFLNLLVLTVVLSCSPTQKTAEIDHNNPQYWTLEKAKKQASDFNSPDTWDTKTLEMEVEYIDALTSQDLPLFPSPFPTPLYDSPGNGNGPIKTEIAGKSLEGHYAIIGKGEHSNHLFKNPKDEYVVYFSVLSIADGQGNGNPVSATSRNHPHYLSQGSINTSTKSRADWVAVQLADQNAYAIINSRLFDLRAGRLILVAPQKDGTIRFYQTAAPPMNLEEQKEYIKNLESQPKVIDFLNNENNI